MLSLLTRLLRAFLGIPTMPWRAGHAHQLEGRERPQGYPSAPCPPGATFRKLEAAITLGARRFLGLVMRGTGEGLHPVRRPYHLLLNWQQRPVKDAGDRGGGKEPDVANLRRYYIAKPMWPQSRGNRDASSRE